MQRSERARAIWLGSGIEPAGGLRTLMTCDTPAVQKTWRISLPFQTLHRETTFGWLIWLPGNPKTGRSRDGYEAVNSRGANIFQNRKNTCKSTKHFGKFLCIYHHWPCPQTVQPADHEGCPQWCHPMEDKRDISELGFQWVFSSLNPRKETTNTSTVSLHLSELMLWFARVNFTSAIAGSELNKFHLIRSISLIWGN